MNRANLSSDKEAVTEIVGTILLLAIAVVLFAVVAIFVLSSLHAPASAHTNLEASSIGSNVTIYHKGGNDL
ncbi:MAG: hypothetical protein CVT48_06460, partial [Thermoplasmata archaeon HGW-Thermoplasmata-1]